MSPGRLESTLFLMLFLLVAGVATGCRSDEASGAVQDESRQAELAEARGKVFTEVAEELGISHLHRQPYLDEKLSNIMSWMASVGAAVAAADYNGDGRVDLFFTNSHKGEPNFLYRNEGDGTFTEVAAAAGLADGNGADAEGELGASMDAVWGDYDNDGDPDLYLVRWGRDSLYRNEGDGTFRDVSAEVFRRPDGTPGTPWANGNAVIFLDYDRDGRLDLYVGNYFREVDLWHLEDTRVMHDSFETARNAGRNYLYHQRPDGTFEEVAGELGVDDTGWTLAVGSADVNLDGWPDLYCANDFGPDQLFLGGPEGMTNVTEKALGYDTKKGMNTDFGDFNNDGWMDIFVTNITTAEYLQEGNMLWYNQGVDEAGIPALTDISLEAGTYDGGWGWGGKFFDFDNDGDLDVMMVNGFISAGDESYWYDLASWTVKGEHADDAANWPTIGDRSFSGYEAARLWRNDGLYSFTEHAKDLGLDTDRDGRGIALVDFDDDGDLDVVLANQNQQPQVFRNETEQKGASSGAAGRHWLGVVLETEPALAGEDGPYGVTRDAVGARVTALAGGRLVVRERDGGNGYSGQGEGRLHFGLGEAKEVELLEVRWPDGGYQYVENVPADGYITVRRDRSHESAESLIPIETPTWEPETEPVETAAGPRLSPEEIDAELGRLESRLREGYDLHLASTYRGKAAEYGENDRAIAFLAERVEAGGGAPYEIDLAVAYVDNIPTCGGLAAIVCKGTQAQKGIDVLDGVIERRPDDWLAYYSRGMNHLHWPRALGHSDDAARDLERAVEIQEAKGEGREPYAERVWVALGQAYAKDGRYEEARKAWRRGQERFPDSAELKSHLAVKGEAALAELVKEKRSLEKSIDTDLSFYEASLRREASPPAP